MREWSWWKGGTALGLLSAFAFLTYKPLGVSTSYPRAVALAINLVAPEWVAANAYFQQVLPVVDWQLMLVVGIVIGGFLAARVQRRAQGAPGTAGEAAACSPVAADAGDRPRPRWMMFLGGFLIIFGARLAGGCTSGHVITGMTQLAVASFIFAAMVFAVGIPMARYLNRKVV
ncbi:MAG: YeeE/YedE family protein [Firmicutes bacterium]|nr:YeeE/YedE family protein [Bacillota bacterium]